MRLRDRLEPEDTTTPQFQTADAGGDGDTLRGAGEAFLAAADEAINRALSGNSEEFLAQNRQMGGQ